MKQAIIILCMLITIAMHAGEPPDPVWEQVGKELTKEDGSVFFQYAAAAKNVVLEITIKDSIVIHSRIYKKNDTLDDHEQKACVLFLHSSTKFVRKEKETSIIGMPEWDNHDF